MSNEEIVKKLREVIEAYNKAADKFITKVDTGQARSVETYRDLKRARALSLEADPDGR